MEITLELIVFTVLAVFTAVSALLAVTTKRILRAATYLLFVLFGTAGIYFQLNYSFLGAVQLLIYAGGITVLYVFSILLTSSQGDKSEDLRGYKLFVGLAATLLSLGVCLYVTLGHDFRPSHFVHGELHVQTIGHALMSSGKYGYVLPFEVISILLLACIVGGILIARKRKKSTAMIHMDYYLVLSTIMMFVGIYGFVTRRNLLAMLISVELILNSVDINFVVFNRFLFPEQLEGFFFTLFAIGISAAETAVAIAIIINIYRNIRNIEVKSLREMKW